MVKSVWGDVEVVGAVFDVKAGEAADVLSKVLLGHNSRYPLAW